MFSGWSLPPEQPVSVAQTIDYRSEIITRVVGPCFLDSVKRNRCRRRQRPGHADDGESDASRYG